MRKNNRNLKEVSRSIVSSYKPFAKLKNNLPNEPSDQFVLHDGWPYHFPLIFKYEEILLYFNMSTYLFAFTNLKFDDILSNRCVDIPTYIFVTKSSVESSVLYLQLLFVRMLGIALIYICFCILYFELYIYSVFRLGTKICVCL